MKPKAFVFYLVLCCVMACKSPVVTKHHTIGHYLTPILAGDTTQVFERTSFATMIDTLKYTGEVLPYSVSLVEYYGTSTYTVSNIKCLLLEYPEKGVINLFRYQYNTSKWVLFDADTIATDRFQNVKHEIENSRYWNTVDDDSYPLVADKVSYASVRTESDSVTTRFRNDPDQMFREQIITLTTSDTE